MKQGLRTAVYEKRDLARQREALAQLVSDGRLSPDMAKRAKSMQQKMFMGEEWERFSYGSKTPTELQSNVGFYNGRIATLKDYYQHHGQIADVNGRQISITDRRDALGKFAESSASANELRIRDKNGNQRILVDPHGLSAQTAVTNLGIGQTGFDVRVMSASPATGVPETAAVGTAVAAVEHSPELAHMAREAGIAGRQITPEMQAAAAAGGIHLDDVKLYAQHVHTEHKGLADAELANQQPHIEREMNGIKEVYDQLKQQGAHTNPQRLLLGMRGELQTAQKALGEGDHDAAFAAASKIAPAAAAGAQIGGTTDENRNQKIEELIGTLSHGIAHFSTEPRLNTALNNPGGWADYGKQVQSIKENQAQATANTVATAQQVMRDYAPQMAAHAPEGATLQDLLGGEHAEAMSQMSESLDKLSGHVAELHGGLSKINFNPKLAQSALQHAASASGIDISTGAKDAFNSGDFIEKLSRGVALGMQRVTAKAPLKVNVTNPTPPIGK
jgi:hypothetical protein